MIRWTFFGFLILFLGFSACQQKRSKSLEQLSLDSFQHLVHPSYVIHSDSIRQYIHAFVSASNDVTSQDSALTAHYEEGDGAFFWLGEHLVQRAHSMLHWLEHAPQHGLDADYFDASSIREKLTRLRSLQLQPGESISQLLATLEYQLTASYLSYTCGLRYGFLSPGKILNNLEEDTSPTNQPLAPEAKKKMKELYVIRLKRCNKEFALNALATLQQTPFAAFRQAQPTSSYYLKLQQELNRLGTQADTDSIGRIRDCVRVNLERARWQYAQDRGAKYVFVNIAAFRLWAVNEESDSILEMRICSGSPKHQTPLLSSRIYFMELNPYWNVPQNIILKEAIPTYRRDTTYFTRNRMKVYDKEGNALNPHDIQWSKYTTGVPFVVKQDNKEGNSLGRIIFRFPNAFDVYLHDTPSRWAFTRTDRAISHGCVRLEKAADLAFFLLKAPDEQLEDRIRIAMDIPPKSDAGKKLRRSEAYKELEHYSLKSYIPLFLDYQTAYLDTGGVIRYCNDVYGYDAPLLEALAQLNNKLSIIYE